MKSYDAHELDDWSNMIQGEVIRTLASGAIILRCKDGTEMLLESGYLSEIELEFMKVERESSWKADMLQLLADHLAEQATIEAVVSDQPKGKEKRKD